MRRLSSLILILALLATARMFAQSNPHGASFKATCTDCHQTTGWKIDIKSLAYDHSKTNFPLTGQHLAVNCRLCHKTLEFSKAGRECSGCHTDIHNQTLGSSCDRCHTPVSWVVNDITGMHQRSRFPLVGAHVTADCYDCHVNASATLLNFAPLGTQCIDCHQKDYNSTTNPSHVAGNYSKNCTDCHNMTAYSWNGASINHNFFPLTLGHSISDCKTCHKTPDYSGTSPVCISCHQPDYNNANNPSHTSGNFPTDCMVCHTTNPGWQPVTFRDHDARYFPIYSGKHAGEWNQCSECHPNPAQYGQFTCISCHHQGEMTSGHEGVQGYVFSDPACLACHPTGSSEGTFNHATSPFPLTGAHATTECIKCHANGYPGTPTDCYACHAANFNQSNNPPHQSGNFPTTCATCHTTVAWSPATFDHSTIYPFTGAHIPIASNCAKCHNGNYVNTPNTCEGCHMPNYTATTNPNHVSGGFPTTCAVCHTTSAWSPASFDHNTVYPLTGAHATIAANCVQCHPSGYINTPNTCAGCHLPNYNASVNPNHGAISIPTECMTCHTTNPGWKPATFPIHNNYYVLAGAHATIANNCAECHNGNYVTTPNTCVGCHQSNYNQTTNPNHAAAQFPTTCSDCHSQSAWTPANWNHDGQYFPIYSGKHKNKWNTCSDCHPNSANYAVFTCTTSCHPQNSTNNDHQGVAGYSYNSAACLNCHPTGGANKLLNKIERQN